MASKTNTKGFAEKQKSFWKDFQAFIAKGNVIGLAVGVVIGGAFQGIVNSLVNDIIMPLVSFFTTDVDFSQWYWDLSVTFRHQEPAGSLEQALEAAHAVISYGNMIAVVINFFIMALVIFLLVRSITKFSEIRPKKTAEEEAPEPEPTTKKCPYCISEIPIEATRCPHCTSAQPDEQEAV